MDGKITDPADEPEARQAITLFLELEPAPHRRIPSESVFRTVADLVPAMIWTADADFNYTYFNRAWLTFRGRRMEDETGSGWMRGLHSDDRDLTIETYLKAFAGRQPFRMKCRLLRADGEFCWIENTGAPRFNDAGEFAGYVGAAMELREHGPHRIAPDAEAVRKVSSLTERERQVLVLIAGGKSTRQAGELLGITYKTADSHRTRILEKLEVHETASVVRYAIRAGLIEP